MTVLPHYQFLHLVIYFCSNDTWWGPPIHPQCVLALQHGDVRIGLPTFVAEYALGVICVVQT